MWGEEVFPAVLYAAAFHSFSLLTLFDCERGREERGGERNWKRGTGGASSLLHNPLCDSFHFEAGETGKERKKRRGTDLCWPVRNYLTTPRLTLDSLCFLSPSSLPPPTSSKCFFTPLHANLHFSPLCPPSFLLFPFSSPPSSVAGATLSGKADRYVNWAGSLTRTACKIILGAAQRQVIKLNFRPVDLIGTGN